MSTNEFNKDTVRKVLNLARLEAPEEQLDLLTNQLKDILGYMEDLDSVDVSNVAPMSHVQEATNVFRDDVAISFSNKEAILDNTPDRSGDFIRVPLIVEG